MMNTDRIYKDHIPGWLKDLIAKLYYTKEYDLDRFFGKYVSTGAIKCIAKGRFYSEGFIFNIIKKGITSDMILRDHPDIVFIQNIICENVFIQVTYTTSDISSIPIFPGHLSDDEELPEHLSKLADDLQKDIRGRDALYAQLHRLCDEPGNDFRWITPSRFSSGNYLVDVLRFDVPTAFDWVQNYDQIHLLGNIPVTDSNLFIRFLKLPDGMMDMITYLPEDKNSDGMLHQEEPYNGFWVSCYGNVSQPGVTSMEHFLYLSSIFSVNKIKNFNFRLKSFRFKLRVSEIEMVFPEDRENMSGSTSRKFESECVSCIWAMRRIQAQETVINVNCNFRNEGYITFNSLVEEGDNGDDYYGMEHDLYMYAFMNLRNHIMTPFAAVYSKEAGLNRYMAINNLTPEKMKLSGLITVDFEYPDHLGYYAAKRGGYWGVIDSALNVIIPFEYREISISSDATFKMY